MLYNAFQWFALAVLAVACALNSVRLLRNRRGHATPDESAWGIQQARRRHARGAE